LTPRTEILVRRNETRDAAARDRVALAELNSIDPGYENRAGGLESEQTLGLLIRVAATLNFIPHP
jgi:hypothetical protein